MIQMFTVTMDEKVILSTTDLNEAVAEFTSAAATVEGHQGDIEAELRVEMIG